MFLNLITMRKMIFLMVLCIFLVPYRIKGAGATIVITEESGNVGKVRITNFVALDAPFSAPSFYSIFIEWGDGSYESGSVTGPGWSTLVFERTHVYIARASASLIFDVRVSITPVKSSDEKPQMQKVALTITPPPAGSPPPVTDYVSDEDEINIFSDWNGGVDKEDIITVGIVINDELVFENLSKGGANSGQIQLYYNSSHVTPINPRVDAATDLFGRTHPLYFNTSPPEEIVGSGVFPFTPGDDPFLFLENTAYNAKLVWNYTRQSGREIVLFMDFQVNENAPVEENSYIHFLGFVRNTSTPPDRGSLMDQDENGVPDPDPLGILASDIHSLKVTPSRDPNGLTILSERIINDDQSTTLVFQIDFFNEGEGSEDNIDIYFYYPKELDISTYQAVEYILRKERLIPNVGSPLLQIQQNVIHNSVPAIKFSFTGANLLGLGAGLIDPRDSEGRIIFKMKTRTPPDCDIIFSNAEIVFNDGNDTEVTEKVGIECVACNPTLGTDGTGSGTNYLYWCLVFILVLAVFLLAVWLVSLKMKQNSIT
ncbi:MAG: hypothetical protein SF052_09940 [Bacteroidia bacterium]|nr:hypothetical protein [Bacteroidia bacterium]